MRSIFIAFLLCLLASPAFAQYSKSRAQNAPMVESTETYFDDDGVAQERTVRKAAKRNKHGNAAGNQHDLAVDGAFEGQTIAVLHFYTQEGFDFSLPKAALADKGFSVYRWMNQPPPIKEFKKQLKKACQLWLISDATRKLSDAHVKEIKRFFESGRGVYIWGDNQPYYADANVVAEALLGSGMDGNLMGDKIVEVDLKNKDKGLRMGHDITTGLEFLYEGITIATIRPTDDLEPILYGSAGNLVTAIYNKNGKRAVLDGGFTRLYISWDDAGTARYVKNAASWLVNYERFGDKVVGSKIKKAKKLAKKKK